MKGLSVLHIFLSKGWGSMDTQASTISPPPRQGNGDTPEKHLHVTRCQNKIKTKKQNPKHLKLNPSHSFGVLIKSSDSQKRQQISQDSGLSSLGGRRCFCQAHLYPGSTMQSDDWICSRRNVQICWFSYFSAACCFCKCTGSINGDTAPRERRSIH